MHIGITQRVVTIEDICEKISNYLRKEEQRSKKFLYPIQKYSSYG